MGHAHPPPPGGRGRARPRLRDIFRKHGPDYARTHALPPHVGKVLNCLNVCRTAALGGHLDYCPACSFERPSYNSCRNRHCPSCQFARGEEWIALRSKRLLPVKHFHVVFTLPGQLRPLAAHNPKVVYDLLLKAAGRTLQALAKNELKATLGITTVLHTWRRDLLRHPHVHCIVSGGGLSLDRTQWVSVKGDFLFPVRVMAALFRGKLLNMLKVAHRDNKLTLSPGSSPLNTLLRPLYKRRWVVYAKRAFGSVDHVVRYLGRYTHRVAISDSRLVSLTDNAVTFRTRGGKTTTLTPAEFIRRFLLHVLPPGFRKIRHLGLYAPSSVRRLLPFAKSLVPAEEREESPAPAEQEDSQVVPLCPRCQTPLHCVPIPPVYLDSS